MPAARPLHWLACRVGTTDTDWPGLGKPRHREHKVPLPRPPAKGRAGLEPRPSSLPALPPPRGNHQAPEDMLLSASSFPHLGTVWTTPHSTASRASCATLVPVGTRPRGARALARCPGLLSRSGFQPLAPYRAWQQRPKQGCRVHPVLPSGYLPDCKLFPAEKGLPGRGHRPPLMVHRAFSRPFLCVWGVGGGNGPVPSSTAWRGEIEAQRPHSVLGTQETDPHKHGPSGPPPISLRSSHLLPAQRSQTWALL